MGARHGTHANKNPEHDLRFARFWHFDYQTINKTARRKFAVKKIYNKNLLVIWYVERIKLSNPKIVTTSNLVLVWLDWNSIQAAKQAKHKNSAFSTNLYTCLGFLLCVNVCTYVLNLVLALLLRSYVIRFAM